MADFVPLPLLADWVLERALGWRVLEQRPGELKILVRRRGPLRAFLLLSRGLSQAAIAAAARRQGALGALAVSTWAELGPQDAGPAAPIIALDGARFARADAQRFFGAGTFVVDLSADEAALWARVSAGKRKEARHVERAGARVTCAPAQAEDLRDYLTLHALLAGRKRVAAAPAAALERLRAERLLWACRARDAQGATRLMNLLYVAHGQGYFLYGASDAGLPAGLGLLAQWQAVRALRALGCRFYDLGLVASTSDEDGVYRFKRALGGVFVPYGAEYRRVPPWLAPALTLRARWRRARG